MSAAMAKDADIEMMGPMRVQMIDVDGQLLRVGIKDGPAGKPPILMFNGIGANLELAVPFMEHLKDTGVIIFDIPGVGGSPMPKTPYRPSTLGRMSKRLLEILGHEQVYVSGISWGGAMAQQFARQFPDVTLKLILIVTSPGSIMVPGAPNVLAKMASPRRYTDKGYMAEIAGDIYGGRLRQEPELLKGFASAMKGTSQAGYMLQLFGMLGFTSLPWLWTLKMPVLIMAGTDDPLVPEVNARMMHSLLPNSRLELFDDGHLFIVTDPEPCAEMIEGFLNG